MSFHRERGRLGSAGASFRCPGVREFSFATNAPPASRAPQSPALPCLAFWHGLRAELRLCSGLAGGMNGSSYRRRLLAAVGQPVCPGAARHQEGAAADGGPRGRFLEAKDKPPVLALREIATGKVRFDRSCARRAQGKVRRREGPAGRAQVARAFKPPRPPGLARKAGELLSAAQTDNSRRTSRRQAVQPPLRDVPRFQRAGARRRPARRRRGSAPSRAAGSPLRSVARSKPRAR